MNTGVLTRKEIVMLRYLNMFVLIGIALILISFIGFATGNKFLTEPGQTPNPNVSLVYLGAGVLMLFNGYLCAHKLMIVARSLRYSWRTSTQLQA